MTSIRHFLIIGQPRSGTTYVQTLVNSSRRMICRGELFDPWQIDDNGRKNRDLAAVRARDADPAGFLTDRLAAGNWADPPDWSGAKVLFQHHFALFRDVIPANPSWHVVHVRRANKLAQFASQLQVNASGEWTRVRGKGDAPRIKCSPQWAMSETNRLANEDFLLSAWIDSLPNPVLRLEYDRINHRQTPQALIRFFGLSRFTRLHSPLVKQGQNRISERFENRQEIEEHFAAVGREDWLREEIG